MIIYTEQGNEIQYGRDKRIYSYSENALTPDWVISPDAIVTFNDKIKMQNEVKTKSFYINKIDCIRFKLSNLTNLNSQSSFKMASADESVIVEIKDSLNSEQVSLFVNTILIEDLPEKIKFRGLDNYNRPKNLEIVFFPLSKTIYLLQNNFVVFKRKLDIEVTQRFYFSFKNAEFTANEVRVEVQSSC